MMKDYNFTELYNKIDLYLRSIASSMLHGRDNVSMGRSPSECFKKELILEIRALWYNLTVKN